VQLVEVDVVGVQALEAVFAGHADEVGVPPLGQLGMALALAGVGVDVVAELGGDDHLVAHAGKGFRQHRLAAPLAVNISRVKEGDAVFLVGLAQELDAELLVGHAPPLGGHRPDAEANFGYLYIGAV
jgi:hypothetical protein